MRYVALLRGINVGGRNRLPMPVLVEVATSLGYTALETYLQSGNLLFDAPARDERALADELSQAIAAGSDIEVPVVVRPAAHVVEVARRHPFADRAAAPKELHVLFLRDEPADELVEALDHGRSAVDAFAVAGREVYLYLENAGRTTLGIGWFERSLGTTGTQRNWLTVTALATMG